MWLIAWLACSAPEAPEAGPTAAQRLTDRPGPPRVAVEPLLWLQAERVPESTAPPTSTHGVPMGMGGGFMAGFGGGLPIDRASRVRAELELLPLEGGRWATRRWSTWALWDPELGLVGAAAAGGSRGASVPTPDGRLLLGEQSPVAQLEADPPPMRGARAALLQRDPLYELLWTADYGVLARRHGSREIGGLDPRGTRWLERREPEAGRPGGLAVRATEGDKPRLLRGCVAADAAWWSTDGARLACRTPDGLSLFDVDRARELAKWDSEEEGLDPALAIVGRQRVALLATDGRTVVGWDPQDDTSWRVTVDLPVARGSPPLAWTDDGSLLLALDKGGAISAFLAEDGTHLEPSWGRVLPVLAVAANDVGQVAALREDALLVWEPSGELIGTCTGLPPSFRPRLRWDGAELVLDTSGARRLRLTPDCATVSEEALEEHEWDGPIRSPSGDWTLSRSGALKHGAELVSKERRRPDGAVRALDDDGHVWTALGPRISRRDAPSASLEAGLGVRALWVGSHTVVAGHIDGSVTVWPRPEPGMVSEALAPPPVPTPFEVAPAEVPTGAPLGEGVLLGLGGGRWLSGGTVVGADGTRSAAPPRLRTASVLDELGLLWTPGAVYDLDTLSPAPPVDCTDASTPMCDRSTLAVSTAGRYALVRLDRGLALHGPDGRVPLAGVTARSAVMSADGSVVAAADGERLWLWHRSDRRLAERTIEDPGEGVIALSPDGRTLAALASSEAVTLFDTERGTPIGVLETGIGPYRRGGALAFAPDGNTLAARIRGQLVRWSLPNGLPERRTTHPGPIEAVALDRAGARVASWSADGTLALWDVGSGGAIATIPDVGGVDSMSFEGAELVVGTKAEPLRFGADGALLQGIPRPVGRATGIRFADDGELEVLHGRRWYAVDEATGLLSRARPAATRLDWVGAVTHERWSFRGPGHSATGPPPGRPCASVAGWSCSTVPSRSEPEPQHGKRVLPDPTGTAWLELDGEPTVHANGSRRVLRATRAEGPRSSTRGMTWTWTAEGALLGGGEGWWGRWSKDGGPPERRTRVTGRIQGIAVAASGTVATLRTVGVDPESSVLVASTPDGHPLCVLPGYGTHLTLGEWGRRAAWLDGSGHVRSADLEACAMTLAPAVPEVPAAERLRQRREARARGERRRAGDLEVGTEWDDDHVLRLATYRGDSVLESRVLDSSPHALPPTLVGADPGGASVLLRDDHSLTRWTVQPLAVLERASLPDGSLRFGRWSEGPLGALNLEGGRLWLWPRGDRRLRYVDSDAYVVAWAWAPGRGSVVTATPNGTLHVLSYAELVRRSVPLDPSAPPEHSRSRRRR